jgi:hypothetical protein
MVVVVVVVSERRERHDKYAKDGCHIKQDVKIRNVIISLGDT